MPLTVRTNGSLVSAAWWNDYYNLLTGVMLDQQVSLGQSLRLLRQVPTIAAPTLATASGTALGVGTYKYAVSFLSASGETLPGSQATITTTTNNQVVTVSNIPVGPSGTTGRRVYRTKVNGSALYLVTTINDNTSTVFIDTTPDGSISASPPSHDAFSGVLYIQRSDTGAIPLILYPDGSIWTDSGSLYTDGSGNLTLPRLYCPGGINVLDMSASADLVINVPNVGGGHKLYVTVGGTRVLSIDGNGNAIFKGTVTQNGSP